ncbi:MAG: aminotransferase class I/II-fold pyridoxal phosphate-dependent enzyme [Eubacteriales bacterium]|nr:aminotransferase class I/II-fold pyridoxal phosphate-dependent enzyme [Eubacteriales bacterium]
MDIFEKCRLYKRVEIAKQYGIYPYFHEISSAQDNVVTMEGHEVIMLGSNNYLGLTSDPRVKAAAIASIEHYGTGCSGSRFLNGNLDLHRKLEEAQARFLKKEACLCFSTGFQSNLGIISAIAGRNDYILSDALNHASINDACRLSFAKTYKYAHSDMGELERLLRRIRGSGSKEAGILIVSDGVFSMEGEICKLPEIVDLARQYNARILIDDAHGLGVLGASGAGTAEHFGLEAEVDLIMNTFSKSYASLGGCVAGSADVINYIKHVSRPFIFSASISPAMAASALAAQEILASEPERVTQVQENSRFMWAELQKYPAVKLLDKGNDIIPIIAILSGNPARTLYSAQALLTAGVYVNPVLPPAVDENSCLLRSSYSATQSKEILAKAAAIIGTTFAKLDADPNLDFDSIKI